MCCEGFWLGLGAFLMVGLCHPLVIVVEYHLGRRVWWVLLLLGLGAFAASLWLTGWLSLLLGVLGACFSWSTLELFWQHQRVALGRARRNPRRPASYYQLSSENSFEKNVV